MVRLSLVILGVALMSAPAPSPAAPPGQNAEDNRLANLFQSYLDEEFRIHPLFATRGPPGTHDVALASHVFAALDRGEAVALPRFDKAQDDRAPPSDWPIVGPCLDVLIFEGWCIGASPQPDEALAAPINGLERDEDRDGVWRRYANAALDRYQPLFARIDAQIFLRAPSFAVVHGWRLQQEEALRAKVVSGAGLMKAAQIARFIQHYERLTRWIAAEMPARADLVAELAEDRSIRRLVPRA